MLTHGLRIVIAAAIGACVTGALVASAARPREALPLSASSTPSIQSTSSPNPTPPYVTSYRLDPATGPPTPGPTDPNGPLS